MHLAKLADRFRAQTEILADAAAQDLGLPRGFVRAQVAFGADAIGAITTEWSDLTDNEVAFLFPGNTEGAMAVFLIAQARAMGWKVRAKISTRAPGVHLALAACFADVDGVVIEVIPGPAFLASVLNDDRVRYIQVFGDDAWIDGYRAELVKARKPLAFDGPGKDALLVLEGADVDAAVDAATDLGLFAGGAACMSAERFYVHASVADAFVRDLIARLSGIRPTAPWKADGVLGVAASPRAVQRMVQQIEDAQSRGARLVLGNLDFNPVTSPTGRTFFAVSPVILLDVPERADILWSETFGPVFPIVTFDGGPAEGIRLVEDTNYGLTATVFGPEDEVNTAAAVLRTSHAVVYANSTMLNAFRPEYWGSGGFKKSGWVWEVDRATKAFTVRHGFRTLVNELAPCRGRRERLGQSVANRELERACRGVPDYVHNLGRRRYARTARANETGMECDDD